MSKILKNTAYLYLRMILVMIVSLYTSRVILASLGVVDYGIFNVVSGLVVSFSFITTTMSTTSMRYYSIEVGKNNRDGLIRLFNINRQLYIILALIFIIVVEIVGTYLLNNVLDIPNQRFKAAHYLFQFSLISCVLQILQTPYTSAILATEKMSIYGYIGVFEACAKLLISICISYIQSDRLILYGGLLVLMNIVVFYIYYRYCSQGIDFCIIRRTKDLPLLKKIVNFSGWSLLESVTDILSIQGINILLNVFIGVVVNAAAGISNQVTSIVWSFISNFQTAFKPQLTKYYSQGDKNNYMRLLFQSSKLSFFLYYIIALPLFINLSQLFELWLVDVPEYSVEISRVMLVNLMIGTLAAPIHVLVQAQGRIQKYQLYVTTVMLLNFPFAYCVLKFSFPPYWVFIMRGIVALFAHISRLLFMRNNLDISIRLYLRRVILPMISSAVIPIIPAYFVCSVTDGIVRLVLSTFISILFSFFIFYCVGLTDSEKEYIKLKLLSRI